MNILEKFIEDIEKRHEEKHNQKLPSIFHASPRVTYGDLRRQVKEYRELEVKLEDWELHSKGMEVKVNSLMKSLKELEFENMELKTKLAQREGECCENCVHGHLCSVKEEYVECEFIWDSDRGSWVFPSSRRGCQHYTAKPKEKRCRWEVKGVPIDKYTEEEAREKFGSNLIGPVEGTWEGK